MRVIRSLATAAKITAKDRRYNPASGATYAAYCSTQRTPYGLCFGNPPAKFTVLDVFHLHWLWVDFQFLLEGDG